MRKEEFKAVLTAIQKGNRFSLDGFSRRHGPFPSGSDPRVGELWMIHAIVSDAVGAIKWMVERGVSVNKKNSEGFSPLHACIEHSRSKKRRIMKMLLDAGADANQIGYKGWSPLHMAAVRNDIDDLKVLILAGANPLARTESGLTAVEEAESVGSIEAADFLRAFLPKAEVS